MSGDGSQLEGVTDEDDLHTTEGQSAIFFAEGTKDLVDHIDEVGPYHGHFINDQQIKVLDDLALGFTVFEILKDKLTAFLSRGSEMPKTVIIRHKRRIVGIDLEEGVDGHATCIHCRHAGVRQHDGILLHCLLQVLQEGRLSGSRPSRKEHWLPRGTGDLERLQEFWVILIERQDDFIGVVEEVEGMN